MSINGLVKTYVFNDGDVLVSLYLGHWDVMTVFTFLRLDAPSLTIVVNCCVSRVNIKLLSAVRRQSGYEAKCFAPYMSLLSAPTFHICFSLIVFLAWLEDRLYPDVCKDM